MAKKIDTLIIGGGQAGLSLSYLLTRQGREHAVLEKNRIGETWRSRRWDSFTLVTPNWQLKLPGFEYDGDDPDGFLSRDQLVQYLDEYAASFHPPVHSGVEASRLKKTDDGYLVETTAGSMKAKNVGVATGSFQKPRIPEISASLPPGVLQVHSGFYRNPGSLPPGAVLVIGSGQSGCQIAEELNESGKTVYLSTGKAGRAPRKYRGKDFTWWLDEIGLINKTVDQLDSPAERFRANPRVSGRNGGHSLNLRKMSNEGIKLTGHLESADGTMLRFKNDLEENLAVADKFERQLTDGVDDYIEKKGLDMPDEKMEEIREINQEPIRELQLDTSGINTIIWANGYSFDYSWIDLPILDEFGYPVQKRGVTEYPGLFFLGLHWMHTVKSGLFLGIGEDARYIADQIQ